VTILEPTTMITDYLLGGLAAVLGMRLWRAGGASGETTVRLWGGSLLTTAVAAFLGGTSHGFAAMLGPTGQMILWKSTVWSIGLTSFQLLAATAHAAFSGAARRTIIGLAALQLVVFVAWMIRHDAFIWVIADYLPAVLAVLAVQFRLYLRHRAGAGWLVAGLLTTLVGAAIQASEFALHPSFNHNDLYHVIQMAATVMLYRGALLARDVTQPMP